MKTLTSYRSGFIPRIKRPITIFVVALVGIVLISVLPTWAYTPSFPWTRQFGSALDDGAHAVAANGGRVAVAGTVTGTLDEQVPLGAVDAYVRVYDTNGILLWTRQFGTPDMDEARGVTMDAFGHVYVSGVTRGTFLGQTSSGIDFFIIKYNPNGTLVWVRQFGTHAADNFRTSLTVDPEGHIYFATSIDGTYPGQTGAGGQDALLIKLDTSGNFLWVRQFGTPALDSGQVIVADASGVYIAGQTAAALVGTSAGLEDVFVRKYDSDGFVAWTNQFGTVLSDAVGDLALDVMGSLFLSGATPGILPGQAPAGGLDGYLQRYDASTGNIIWTRQFGTSEADDVTAIGATPGGMIFVGGWTQGAFPDQVSAGGSDIFVRTYDRIGNYYGTLQLGSFGDQKLLDGDTDAEAFYVGGLISPLSPLPGQFSTGGTDSFVARVLVEGHSIIDTGPTITHFFPTHGGAGTVVTINGRNLTRSQSVRFNNVAAAFAVYSDLKIQAIVPAGALTGPITITTPTGVTTSNMEFTLQMPNQQITAFIATVDRFSATGEISNLRRANSLKRSLARGLSKLEQGNLKGTKRALNMFIKKVKQYKVRGQKDKKMTATANELIAQAKAILESVNAIERSLGPVLTVSDHCVSQPNCLPSLDDALEQAGRIQKRTTIRLTSGTWLLSRSFSAAVAIEGEGATIAPAGPDTTLRVNLLRHKDTVELYGIAAQSPSGGMAVSVARGKLKYVSGTILGSAEVLQEGIFSTTKTYFYGGLGPGSISTSFIGASEQSIDTPTSCASARISVLGGLYGAIETDITGGNGYHLGVCVIGGVAELEDSTIHDFTPNSADELGWGAYLGDGNLKITSSHSLYREDGNLFELSASMSNVTEYGIVASGAGSSLTLDLSLKNVSQGNGASHKRAAGILIQSGAEAVIDNVFVQDVDGFVRKAVRLDTKQIATPSNCFSGGVSVLSGAELIAMNSGVSEVSPFGLCVSGGSTIWTGSRISNTNSNNDNGEFGWGVYVADSGVAILNSSSVSYVRGYGAVVTGQGTLLEIEDVEINGVDHPTYAAGVLAQSSAEAILFNSVITGVDGSATLLSGNDYAYGTPEHCFSGGITVISEAVLFAKEVTVTDGSAVKPFGICVSGARARWIGGSITDITDDDSFGWGAYVGSQGNLSFEDVEIAMTTNAGIVADGTDTKLSMSGGSISEIKRDGNTQLASSVSIQSGAQATFDGVTVSSVEGVGMWVSSGGQASANKTIITDSLSAGVAVVGGTLVFEEGTVGNSNHVGFYISHDQAGTSSVEINESTISDNKDVGIVVRGTGGSTIIKKSEISRTAALITHGNGIYAYKAQTGILNVKGQLKISNNTFSLNEGAHLFLQASDAVLISNDYLSKVGSEHEDIRQQDCTGLPSLGTRAEPSNIKTVLCPESSIPFAIFVLSLAYSDTQVIQN